MQAGTADWLDAEDDPEAAGYVMVNALPDLEGVPPSVKRAASRAMATAAPALIKPVGAALGATPRSSTAGDAPPAEEQKAPGSPMRKPSGSGGGAVKEAGAAAAGAKEKEGDAPAAPAAAAAGKDADGKPATEPAAAADAKRDSWTGESKPATPAAAGPPEIGAKGAAEAAAAGATPAAASESKGGSTPKAAVVAAGAAAAATAAVAAAAVVGGKQEAAAEAAELAAPAPEAAAPATEVEAAGEFEDDAFDPFPAPPAAAAAAAPPGRTHSLDSSAAADLAPAADLPSEVHSEVPDEAAAMWGPHEGRTPSGRPSEAHGDGGLVSDDSSLVSGYRPAGGNGLSTQLTGRTSIASSGYEEDQGLNVLQQQLVGDLQRAYGGAGAQPAAGAAAAAGEQHPAPKQSTGGFEDNAF